MCGLKVTFNRHTLVGHILVGPHPSLCSGLIILLLGLRLLLELDDRHSVQVAVCPAVVHTVLKQVLCTGRQTQGTLDTF